MNTDLQRQPASQSNPKKGVVRDFEESAQRTAKVVAIGGGGGHIIDDLAKIFNPMTQFTRAELQYLAFNTDCEDLKALGEDINAVQFGRVLTDGQGAGEDVKTGEQAATDDMEKILSHIGRPDFLLFVVCEGKGSASGGGTAIIEAYANDLKGDSKRRAACVIATEPFTFEGLTRKRKSDAALARIRQTNLPLGIIPNQLLMPTQVTGTEVKDMFNEANKRIAHIIARIIHVMANRLDLWNADWNDIMNVLRRSLDDENVNPDLYFGVGYGSGENRMEDALKEASVNPVLRTKVNGCSSVFMAVHANKVTDKDWVAIQHFVETHRVEDEAKWLYGISNTYDPMAFEDKGVDACVTVIGLGYISQATREEVANEELADNTVVEVQPQVVPDTVVSDEVVMSQAAVEEEPTPPAAVAVPPNTRDFKQVSFAKLDGQTSTVSPTSSVPKLGVNHVQSHYEGLSTFGSFVELATAMYWNNATAAEILLGDFDTLRNKQDARLFANNPQNLAGAVKFLAAKRDLAFRLSPFWQKWLVNETIAQRRLFNYEGTDGAGGKVIFRLTSDMSIPNAKAYVKQAIAAGIKHQAAETDVYTIGHLLDLGELWSMDVLVLLVPPPAPSSKTSRTQKTHFWQRGNSASPPLPV